MAGDAWKGKFALYVDGELEPAEARALGVHLRGCAACAADALEKVEMKRSVAVAGRRHELSAQLRASIAKGATAIPRWRMGWVWRIVAIPAVLVLIASVAVNLYVGRERTQRQRVYSELADLHVSPLASTTPVDELSTDRHTLQPWFQGNIPFTFNLPELQRSEFTLIARRTPYLSHTHTSQLLQPLHQP